MSRKCEICGKGQVSGNTVSHSNRHTRRKWRSKKSQRMYKVLKIKQSEPCHLIWNDWKKMFLKLQTMSFGHLFLFFEHEDILQAAAM